MSTQRTAKLRVCASCEWIFTKHESCPKCGFAHYGARYVYGDKCYRYAKTQEPWMNARISEFEIKLMDEIEESNENGDSCGE